jgi:hypothetical protein
MWGKGKNKEMEVDEFNNILPPSPPFLFHSYVSK